MKKIEVQAFVKSFGLTSTRTLPRSSNYKLAAICETKWLTFIKQNSKNSLILLTFTVKNRKTLWNLTGF